MMRRRADRLLGVTEEGNFEGRTSSTWPAGVPASRPRLDEARPALSSAAHSASGPGLDDKRLCSWNALMIEALAEAGAALARGLPRCRAECAEFIWTRVRDADGRLLRTWKDGEALLAAYLEDYAYLVGALLTLYEASFDVRWFEAARETADPMIELFADTERGGFFTTAHDHDS